MKISPSIWVFRSPDQNPQLGSAPDSTVIDFGAPLNLTPPGDQPPVPPEQVPAPAPEPTTEPTSAPASEPAPTPEPAPKPTGEPAPPAPAPDSEEARVEATMKALESLSAEYMRGYQQTQPEAVPIPVPAPAPAPAPVPAPASAPQTDFLKNLPEDADLSDRQTLNTILNHVYSAGMQAVQDTQRNIPTIVMQQARQIVALEMASQEFYRENPDFNRFKPYVGAVVSKIASEHPNYNLQQLFQETETTIRKQYNLPKPGKNNKPNTPTPNTPGARKVDTPPVSIHDDPNFFRRL
uniref:Uncharacterized protein n=1 Tax=viral metagenome TaxID=1070528 RepID=A0A6M3KS41_9ZZZZ